MRHAQRLTAVLAGALVAQLVLFGDAHAYLDPGTGSYMLQIAIGALLGGIFAIKHFWGRILLFLKHLFARSANTGDVEDQL